MPKCRVDHVTSIKRQVRDYYESGALDEITVNRDRKLTVKEMREMLLIGLESRFVGPVTTGALMGCGAGTIIGHLAFGPVWCGLFLSSLLGIACWVDSL